MLFLHNKQFRPSLVRQAQGGCAGALRCGKGTTWEGGQRVPGLFSYPGQIKPGKSHALTSALDIMPTIMSIVRKASNQQYLHSNGNDGGEVGYDLSNFLLHEGHVSRLSTFCSHICHFCTVIS